MVKIYPAIFHTAEAGGYWVNFPDFAGGTQGETLEEAVKMAEDCLAVLVATYIEDEIELPIPTDIRSIQCDEKSFPTLIHFDPIPYVQRGKAVRTNITVPEWVLKHAKKQRINVSETATNALINQLNL